ncbi:hypothetical protein M9Y10_023252 [Tritrichomonas musculus]|uniref:AGC family protein kinase n=1 Tax=Tritrichomonas musculus TaxID=1915356 RepID=A0ABR2KUJ8_9EUKA
MSSSGCGSDSCEGTLWKNVMLGFWSKRFCRLEGNNFMIFKKKSDKKPEQIIVMSSLVTTEITDATNNKFKIKIPKSSKYNKATTGTFESPSIPNFIKSAEESAYNIFYFQAASKNEMMEWILDLRVCAFANPELSMDMFNIISVLGRGNFGKVMLCTKKDTQEVVAVKTVHKARLVAAQKLYTILTERNILSRVKHPFIISLKYAFQTPTKFYLCLEYAPGGDLFHLLSDGSPPIDDIKLYIAELSLAIEELHLNGVIYRDLKPENVLFDAKGHIKITDFGLSKLFDADPVNQLVSDSSVPITSTFCGTTEYMAPEMIKKTGYSYAIDWWSLGVMTYEMFFGMTPFEAGSKKQIYQNILKSEPHFDRGVDPDVKEFITMLLQKNPKKRGNFDSIKKSKLMANVDFNAVYRKEIPLLHVPYVSDLTDPNNFDKEFTKEAAFDSVVTNEPVSPMVSNFSFSCLTDDNDSLLTNQLNHSKSTP